MMLGLSLLFLKRGSNESGPDLVELMKKTIREEIFAIGFRLFFGILIVAFVILSLWQFGLSASVAMSEVENGLVIRLLVFGFAAFAGTVGLYFCFRSSVSKGQQVQPPSELNLESLAVRFVEGFVSGMQARTSREKSGSRDLKADF